MASVRRPYPTFEWTRDKVKLLISLWERIPLLWDVSLKDYKNRTKRISAIEELAQKFNTDVGEVSRKLHNLRTQFNNELRKSKKMKSGQRSGDVYTSKWEYYEALQFMQSSSKCTETKSNWESHDEDENALSEELPKEKRIRKEDKVLEKALEVMNQKKIPDDDAQIFGNFVASAIRNLRCEEYKRKLKRKIQSAILDIEELDDTSALQTHMTNEDDSATFLIKYED